MASFLHYSHSLLLNPNETINQFFKPHSQKEYNRILNSRYNLVNPPRASSTGDSKSTNGTVESPKPSRRGRKKKETSASSSKKKVRVSDEAEEEKGSVPELGEELGDYEDDMDFPYDDPPLVCCFGAVQKEFVPTVRVHDNQMHPDIYSTWKMLQWDPPEFVRAPGGPPSNVAISHVRLGGRAAFMGKVGADDFGEELVLMMNKEKVQTRAVKFDENVKTSCAYVKIKFEEGKMKAETVTPAAEDSLLSSELNLAVLKEVNLEKIKFKFIFLTLILKNTVIN